MNRQIRNDAALRKIAERLKQLRAATGKYQKDVERETGVNIGSVEAAQYNLSVKTLERLCRYYGVTLAEFFEGLEL